MTFRNLPVHSWFFLSSTGEFANFAKYKSGDRTYQGTHLLWENSIDEDREVIPAVWDKNKLEWIPLPHSNRVLNATEEGAVAALLQLYGARMLHTDYLDMRVELLGILRDTLHMRDGSAEGWLDYYNVK